MVTWHESKAWWEWEYLFYCFQKDKGGCIYTHNYATVLSSSKDFWRNIFSPSACRFNSSCKVDMQEENETRKRPVLEWNAQLYAKISTCHGAVNTWNVGTALYLHLVYVCTVRTIVPVRSSGHSNPVKTKGKQNLSAQHLLKMLDVSEKAFSLRTINGLYWFTN